MDKWNLIRALAPAQVKVVAIVVHTRLEDRMLMDELNGYATYAQETPYRLVPGIWRWQPVSAYMRGNFP
jgi:protein-S-isoprenylcysteine O-methyltransferase Ste14